MADAIRVSRKPRKCPACGSNRIAEIMYGMPTLETSRLVDEGKLVLGGCVTTDDDPLWKCLGCGVEIFKGRK